jgi:CubicO group peptidase (beta-lactamase class C family)
MVRRCRPAATLLAIAIAASLGVRASTAPPGDLDAYVARVMKTFEVPGIGLAIVKDGEVVVARGYGIRRMGEASPVDGKTRFGIASNSKAFTAAALGLLVEEGRLAWDDPVVKHLPAFQMWDPYVTREITVRDLLVHRSGLSLGAGDLLWWPPSTYDRAEVVRRLRFIRPATSFRSAYAYDNVLYLVAGQVIEAVSGQSWEAFIEAHIFQKVGMIGATPRASAVRAGGNTAAPHARVEGTVRPVEPYDQDLVNPAGGIHAGAEDMARWLLVLADLGRLPDGSRLLSERTARELTTLVTPMPIPEGDPELTALRPSFRGYGLGFNVLDFRGRKLVTHTGGLPGFVSRLAVVPDLRLGVAVLTNQETGAAFEALTYRVLDHYLGVPPTDWVEPGSWPPGSRPVRPRPWQRPTRRATVPRGRRCRWPAMRAPIATLGTETW